MGEKTKTCRLVLFGDTTIGIGFIDEEGRTIKRFFIGQDGICCDLALYKKAMEWIDANGYDLNMNHVL